MSPSQSSSIRAVLSHGTTIGWVVVAILWFAIVGAATTILFNLMYSNVLPMIPAAALSAGILGGFFWWALMERGTVTYLRGFTVGGLTGLLAIPVMWFILTITLTGLQTMPPLSKSVSISFIFGIFGFILAGWLTLTLGCLSAVLLTAVRVRFSH